MAATKTGNATRGMDAMQRFLYHADAIPSDPDECWKWNGWTRADGRARMRFNGRRIYAYEIAKILFRGEERPEGYEAHHTCLDGTCINPDHIVYMTQAEHRAEHRRLSANQG